MLLGISTSAQHVTGKVTEADGNPLPGVSILLMGTSIGAASNSDGIYSIALPDSTNNTLAFSFIGFTTQEIPVRGRSVLNVVLVEGAKQLDEVVVTALGIPRETKTLVYATQQVNTKELVEVRDANNFLNSLAGKIANSVITQASGGVGSGARIILRGNRSIQGTNNALIVVDGVPINNSTNYLFPGIAAEGNFSGTDGASNLNPDDIETMTVLPGASATALYGSAAGNGVIVITTKKGKTGQVSVTLNSGVTSERVFILPAVQNQYGQGLNGTIDGTLGECWGYRTGELLFTGYMGETRKYSAQPDNIKNFFRNGLSLNNYVGVTGGSDRMQAYLSYTNNKVQGIIPKNDLDRHTFTLRASSQVSSKFSTDAKITYILQQIDKPGTGQFNYDNLTAIFTIPRNVSLQDAKNFETIDNGGLPEPSPWPPLNNQRTLSPYWNIHRTGVNENRNRIMGFVQARYDITEWLNLSGRANLDKTIDQLETFVYQGTAFAHEGGDFSKAGINVSQKWFDVILSGSNKISTSLKVDYRAGVILQDNQYDALYDYASGLNIANQFSLNFATNRNSSEDASRVQTQSLFAQVNLAFKESIFLDGSVRTDWISTLPPPYTTTYPSVGVSAIISDLVSFPRSISFLKLSANYAEVGNGAPFGVKNNTYDYFAGAGHGFLLRNAVYALEQLNPELVKSLEFSIDGRFLENKIGFTFALYKSNSTNQILRLSLTPASGYSQQLINAGNIQNRGVELIVNATPFKRNKLSWDVAFNMGINRNKVIELHNLIKQAPLGFTLMATPMVVEGKSFGDLIAHRWKRDTLGRYVVTDEGVPVLSEDREYVGNFYPKATLGLTNTVRYDRFSMRLLIDGRIGGIIISGTEFEQAYLGIAEVTAKLRDEGIQVEGVNEAGEKVDVSATAQEFWRSLWSVDRGGEFFAYDATNFRVRELTLSYSMPLPSTFLIKHMRISAVARNLFFLYRGSSTLDIPGIGKRKIAFDPDMALNNSNLQGVEHFSMPSTRSIGFNVQVTF
jgi:TonB-linked SusC/RagA family outer membrane protein